MRGWGEWAERHQVVLYLAAIAVGAVVGLTSPASAPVLEAAITPALAALLYATFLAVPFARIGQALRDRRFLVAVLALNFVLVPIVVFALSRLVAHDAALLAGVLLVLLTPCVDYVIVFAHLAGGARERLLAATPLLMLAQLVLLPGYLWIMAGPDLVGAVEPGPFVEAFGLLIALPLALAALTQLLARTLRPIRLVETGVLGAMVPLMMVVLAIVVGSQVHAVGERLSSLAGVVPLFIAFAALAALLGLFTARSVRMRRPERIATIFSGVTRNSLVVLPLALALPASLSLAPLVVVTQTLVELFVMVVLVALLRRRAARAR
ncbi:arsenic resistance protein [Microbacterium sp. Clip185]|uniref:arsenic resistance protein n=1 Tax=Microbacterium sp. Clip185 TaxID=3025663 RepID=UPI0023667866|nr:bile acid:sodium symporter [Microbacterium sp. Clip185]WDG18823.1 bile acid:sodium symporter [Microbacterium sp. Clip185]